MSTVIRSGAGQALQESSANLLNMIMQGARLNLDREQLAQQAAQFERSQKFAESGRPHAFIQDRLNSLAPGQTMGEAGIPQEMWEQAGLAGFYDPNAVMTPETVASLSNKLTVEAMQSPDFSPALVERLINRELLGVPTTAAILELQDLQAATTLDAFKHAALNVSDRTKELIFEESMGVPSVRFSYGGQEFQFESASAASTATAWMNMDLSRSLAQTGQRDIMLQYQQALLVRMEEAGTQLFGLGQSNARKLSEEIFANKYDSPAALDAIKDPKSRAFVEFQLSSRALSDAALIDQIRSRPGGEGLVNYIELTGILGEDLTPEKVGEMVDPVAKFLEEKLGIPIGRMSRSLIGRNQFVAPGRDVLQVPQTAPAAAPAVIPDDLKDIPMAVDAINAGWDPDIVREELQSLGPVREAAPQPAPSRPVSTGPALPANAPAAVRNRVAQLDREIATKRSELETGTRQVQGPLTGPARRSIIERELRALEEQRAGLIRAAGRF